MPTAGSLVPSVLSRRRPQCHEVNSHEITRKGLHAPLEMAKDNLIVIAVPFNGDVQDDVGGAEHLVLAKNHWPEMGQIAHVVARAVLLNDGGEVEQHLADGGVQSRSEGRSRGRGHRNSS